ncbi:MAG: sulfite exporter TauE/SafE family protein [Desulfobacterota bacterium]|nr:sulfite exporter TauE/SafE family protein [Thermodesulfobacteriota bacterium]
MTLIEFFLFIGVGCIVGFLAGLFGVGGGFVMVPVLILSYEHLGISPEVLTHMAIGTSLFVVLFSSVTSAYQHSRLKNIDWRAVLILGFSSALSAFLTAKVASWLSGRQLRVAFAIIVSLAAIRMLTESETKAEKKMESFQRPNGYGLGGIGLGAGVVSALAGIGGGLFTIPMMYHFLHFPLKRAIGTSSAAIFITAFFSVAGYILNGMGRPGLTEWSLGFVDLHRGIALALGTLFLARLGAKVSFRMNPHRLRKLFALFVILISIYIIAR